MHNTSASEPRRLLFFSALLRLHTAFAYVCVCLYVCIVNAARVAGCSIWIAFVFELFFFCFTVNQNNPITSIKTQSWPFIGVFHWNSNSISGNCEGGLWVSKTNSTFIIRHVGGSLCAPLFICLIFNHIYHFTKLSRFSPLISLIFRWFSSIVFFCLSLENFVIYSWSESCSRTFVYFFFCWKFACLTQFSRIVDVLLSWHFPSIFHVFLHFSHAILLFLLHKICFVFPICPIYAPTWISTFCDFNLAQSSLLHRHRLNVISIIRFITRLCLKLISNSIRTAFQIRIVCTKSKVHQK